MTLLIAEFKNQREADLVAELIRKMPTGTLLQKGKNLEDMYLAELITRGMKEKGTVPLADLRKQLKKRIGKKVE